MKKVLIISDFFFPSANIGAVRPSKIAKMLTQDGYMVDVFTRYPIDKDAERFCHRLYSFEEKSVSAQQLTENSPKSSSGLKKFVRKNFSAVYKALFKIKATIATSKKDNKMLSAFKSFVSSNKERYDVVFTTFGPLGSLLCGLYYKKKYPSVKWICDFRDPAVVSQLGPIRNFFMRLREQQACRAADEIVTVSNGYMERICGNKFKEKRHMISNGYDKDDLIYEKKSSEVSDCLQFVYVGILYGDMRDLTPIFNALNELIKAGEVDRSKLKFNYAGTDCKNLMNQAEQCGLADIVVDHGILSREKCLELQFSSDLLVLSTWNTEKEYGVFPGKLLEYMLIGKPIVTTVTGDIPDSEVSQVIREGNLGVVYEKINHQKDMQTLKEYLKKQYCHKAAGEDISFDPEKQVLNRYNYNNIIRQIEAIIEK